MYYMLNRREKMGVMLRMNQDDDEDDDALAEFLERFDLDKNPETGTIDHFDYEKLMPRPAPDELPPPTAGGSGGTPAEVESDDELDLIGTRTQSRASSVAVVPARRPVSEEKVIVVRQDAFFEPESVPEVPAGAGGDTTDDDDLGPIAEVQEPDDGAVEEGSAAGVPIVVDDPAVGVQENEGADGNVEGASAEEAAEKGDVALAQANANEMVVEEEQDDLFSAREELTPPPPTQSDPEPAPSPLPATDSLESSAPPQPEPPATTEDVEMDETSMQVDKSEDETAPVPDIEPSPSEEKQPALEAEPMAIDNDEEGKVVQAVQPPAQSPALTTVPPTPAAEPLPAPTPPASQETTPAVQVPTIQVTQPQTHPKAEPEVPATIAPSATVLTPDPTSVPASQEEAKPAPTVEETPIAPPPNQPFGFHPNYTLPSLKVLPADFSRKSKPGKQQRKRDKNANGAGPKDDWAPMGISRWGAMLRANPVHTKVSRAPKCLSTKDWGVAMSELRLVRALEQVDALKEANRWSFRQPKKQRGIGGVTKTHWDYLLDEMKWMRTDFREERKWKLALAYHISTAVLEWHCFSTQAERIAKGICVGWRRPKVDEADVAEAPLDLELDDPLGMMDEQQTREGEVDNDEGHEQSMDISMDEDVPDAPLPPKPTGALLALDYGSDDDDDDDDEKEKQDVLDALDPATALEDMDADKDKGKEDEKIREALSMQVDGDEEKPNIKTEESDVAQSLSDGLKGSSNDPTLSLSQPDSLGVAGEPGSFNVAPNTSKAKANVFAPLREYLAYADPDKLVLSARDIEAAVKSVNADAVVFDTSLMPTDLSDLFPELPPLTMFDPPSEGRTKKSDKRGERDDPHKRVEETMHTKLWPVGKFMYTKPTLLGPLQPAKRWKNGQWIPAEDAPIMDYDAPPARVQDSFSELFNPKFSMPPKSVWLEQQKERENKEREAREREAKDNNVGEAREPPKRVSMHIWTAPDDALLRTLVERYPNNWPLIAECYNSARVSISTDTRTARDCHDRWKELAPRPVAAPVEETVPPALLSAGSASSSMTTRGVKRLASASVSGPAPASGSDAKKRRRHHYIVESIRKVGKKRAELAAKALNNQRKPSAIHETHAQYTRMKIYTPAELSRIKTEKDQQEIAAARAKHETMARAAQQQRIQQQQHQQQQQAAGQQPTPVAQVQSQPQAQPAQPPQPGQQPQGQQSTNGQGTSQGPVQAQGQQLSLQQQQLIQAAQAAQQQQQRITAAVARGVGVNISGQQPQGQSQPRVGSPAYAQQPGQPQAGSGAGQVPQRYTPAQQQQFERMRLAAAQQSLIQQQQQQALLAAQANGSGVRVGTPAQAQNGAGRPQMNLNLAGLQAAGLQGYSSETIAQMIQNAQHAQQQQQHQQRQ
ncbi:hypothetical protein MKEN_01055100 [Mycena kentingensis (nom. inval.)]|nr:hypothetical protein MKEN_01055100 [Mycena kentingensis (nom. inval.)]